MTSKLADLIKRGDSIGVESLIASGVADVNARMPADNDELALGLAACFGRTAIVELLLKAGAHIDGAGCDGMTACHHAALEGKDEVFAVLLAHGPDLSIRDRGQRSVLYCAIGSNERIVMMLVEAGAPLDELDCVCEAAAMSVRVIEALVDRGVVISKLRLEYGATPLHFVFNTSTDLAVLNMLVNGCGVDINARNEFGETCLHVAMRSGGARKKIVWLINAGADVDIASYSGNTPLHLAASKNSQYEYAAMLLAAGADVGARNKRGNTACAEVVSDLNRCVFNTKAVAQALVACGADFSAFGGMTMAVRELLGSRMFTKDEITAARRHIAKVRLDFVRYRALQVCIGLQSRGLDALQTCEILQHACGAMAPVIRFHQWWAIATTVKHFR